MKKEIRIELPDFAQAEIDALPNIKSMRFGMAYRVTPAIFVVYEKDGDEFLERVRLVKPDKISGKLR